MTKPLRKVVFPVAGLGTRFLPATKVVAKEMLPVLDKPLIQYAVDEAVDAGADTLIFVTNRYKHAIADYFDKAYELESKLEAWQDRTCWRWCKARCRNTCAASFVTQAEALGLGHAVLCAKPVVGDEPFGVILPDDLIWNRGALGALRQMAELADKENAGAIAVEEVPHDQTDKYGIVDATSISDRAAQIRHVVEKPKPAVAPSNLAIVGRYVLPGRIFSLSGKDQAGRRRRDPIDRRDRSFAARNARARLPLRGHALRLRQQARSGQGDPAHGDAGPEAGAGDARVHSRIRTGRRLKAVQLQWT